MVQIAGGRKHTIALKDDSGVDTTVWTWGWDFYGQLGDGTGSDSINTPVQVKGAGGIDYLTNITAIAGGADHTIALKNDGTVWTWGDNDYGELGDDTNTDTNIPVQAGIGYLTGITKIAGGYDHTIALKDADTVWTWGRNDCGELGDGTNINANTPVQVKGAGGIDDLTNITAIAGGENHTVALKDASGVDSTTVWTWGKNNRGQLGDGTNTDSSNTPVQVKGAGGIDYLINITAIAGGADHTMALKDDGTVWTWGGNDCGQLGDGTNTDTNVPVQVKGEFGEDFLTDIIAIAGGGDHTIALKDDGTVWTWGWDFYGQLGDGTESDSINTPVQVKGAGGIDYLTNITAIAGGADHTMALKDDGTVWTWGGNDCGQLGDGTNTDTNVPVQVVMTPEINLQGNSQTIVDGDTTPSTADETDFGSVDVTGGEVTHTFTIQNTGIADLDLTGDTIIVISGSHASDFTVTIQPSSPVTSNSSTTFQVKFDPSASGIRTATISIATNDNDENPYDFSIRGTGTTTDPNIFVSPTSHNFGSVTVETSSTAKVFTISNIGAGDLSVGTITLSGTNADELQIQNDNASGQIITSSASKTLEVVFSPVSSGSKTATLSIPSDDPDENPCSVSLSGTGETETDTEVVVTTNPEIEVSPASYDFGGVEAGTASNPKTFTISNTGTADLNITAITVSETSSSDTTSSTFSLDVSGGDNPCGSETVTILPDGSNTVTVTFAPSYDISSLKTFSATLAVTSDDPDTPTLEIPLTGTGEETGSLFGECFIATAAFGSPLAKQVEILKRFRDGYLLTNSPGRRFVDWYYQKGPIGARFISQHLWVKHLTRITLYPVIAFVYLLIKGLLAPIILVLAGACLAMTILRLYYGTRDCYGDKKVSRR
ncbi:MAG: choice-of-anchor D domain-containing protein [Candidatus Omnitrophota bacterium]